LTEPLGFSNPKIQRLRRLQGRRSARHDEGSFVVEGPLLVAEAVAAGWPVEAQFVAPDVEPVRGAEGDVHELARGVAERVSDTEATTGLFAVLTIPGSDLAVLDRVTMVVVADGVSDPGNLGTMLRSAEASGAGAVVVTPGTVDVFNPKVVRASAGALFHVPVVAADLDDVRSAGFRLIGTSSHRGIPHTEADWTGRVAILAGAEAHGLGDDAAVDEWVRIEHHGRMESLNVAMAVTVLCFEAARQRR
jgi:TrmH family RNA methyltransferase